MSRLAVLAIVCSLFLPPFTPLAQGEAWRINPPLTSGQNTASPLLSPDGQTVVFLANTLAANRTDLFSVPFPGGNPTKLSPSLLDNQTVEQAAFSSDSHFVYFVVSGSGPEHLYRTPVDGGTPVRLTPAAFTNPACNIPSLLVDPGGACVLYIADQENDGQFCLYRAAADGSSTPVLFSHPTASQVGDVIEMAISPDRTWVVWRADANELLKLELFSRKLDLSTGITTLNGAVYTQTMDEFTISEDSARVMYVADQEAADRYHLYIVPIGGGASTRLSGDFATASGDVNRYASIGTTVVYMATALQPGVNELYAVNQGGGTPVKLCPDQPASGGVAGFSILPDLSGVVYLARQVTPSEPELYRASLSGGAPRRINRNFSGEGPCHAYSLSPDGRLVAYTDVVAGPLNRLYAVAPDGTNPRRADGLLPDGFTMILSQEAVSDRQALCLLVKLGVTPLEYCYYVYLPNKHQAVRLDEGLPYGVGLSPVSHDSQGERAVFLHHPDSAPTDVYANFLPPGGDMSWLLLLM